MEKMNKAFLYSLKLLILLLLVLLLIGTASGQNIPQDLTLIGENQALYSLPSPLNANIISQNGMQMVLEVNDAVVEENRILVRFMVWNIPPEWASRIDDSSRIYGNYLPVAEIGIPPNQWLTPSSGSKYSLVSNGNDLVVAGLLEFLTDSKAQTFSFNFNQIPFDVEPLAEGAVLVLNLEPGDNKTRQELQSQIDTKLGVGFTLMNVAQSPSITMIQPAYQLENPDELLSRTGWITVKTGEGKVVPLLRTNPYGINLTNDSNFVLKNGYLMPAVHKNDPLTISMQDVYLNRKIDGQIALEFDRSLSEQPVGTLDIPVPLDEFDVRLIGYQVYPQTIEMHTHEILRLFMEADPAVSAVYFTSAATSDTASCGFLPDSERFACDLTIESTEIDSITLTYASFEYQKPGVWSIQWTPTAMIRFPDQKTQDPYPISLQSEWEATDLSEIEQQLLNGVKEFTSKLTAKPGWIHEETQIANAVPNSSYPALVKHGDQLLRQSTTIVESWSRVDQDGMMVQNLTITKTLDGEILQAILATPQRTILLPQGLVLTTTDPESMTVYPYLYGAEFYSLFDSSAEFVSRTACDLSGKAADCILFRHSLLENPAAVNDDFSNYYLYWIDPENGQILQKEVSCPLDGPRSGIEPCVTSTTLTLEKQDQLPVNLQTMIDQLVQEKDF